MKVVCVLVFACLIACAVATFTEEEYQTSFISWMHTHKKSYESAEFQTRFATFKSNADFVASWDSAARGFEVEMNKFADMSIEEFSKVYLGTRFEMKDARMVGLPASQAGPAPPASVDWRTQGYVTAIKDQGQCGACWAFSTTGSVEGQNFNKTKTLTSFSEQQLIDCSSSFGNQGCDGGLMDDAFKYLKTTAIVTEASYPYTAKDGKCALTGKTGITKVSAYQDVTSKDEAALQSAISKVGPVSVAIDASHSSFQLYKTGVYYEPACSSTRLDHGVLAVGYGASTAEFYIVKNSWGTTWGMSGYINMSRDKKNNCGIATMASYPLI